MKKAHVTDKHPHVVETTAGAHTPGPFEQVINANLFNAALTAGCRKELFDLCSAGEAQKADGFSYEDAVQLALDSAKHREETLHILGVRS